MNTRDTDDDDNENDGDNEKNSQDNDGDGDRAMTTTIAMMVTTIHTRAYSYHANTEQRDYLMQTMLGKAITVQPHVKKSLVKKLRGWKKSLLF